MPRVLIRVAVVLVASALGCGKSNTLPQSPVPGNPPDTAGQLETVRSLMDREQFSSAERILQQVILVEPDHSEAIFRLSQCIHAKGDTHQGIELLTRISNPDDPWLLPALGQTADWYVERGEFDQAEATLKHAIDLNPNVPLLHRRMSILLNQQGRHYESATYLKALIRLGDVTEAELYGLHALSEAFIHTDTTRTTTDKPRLSELATARLLWFQGDFEQARATAERAQKQDPESPSIIAFLGRVYAELQDRSATSQWLTISNVHATQLPDYWFARGLIYQVNGNLDAAVRCYLETVARDPTDRYAYLRLSQVLKTLGRSEAFIESNRRFDQLSRVSFILNEMIRRPQDIQELCVLLETLHRDDEALAWRQILRQKSTSSEKPRKQLNQEQEPITAIHWQTCGLNISDWPLPTSENKKPNTTPIAARKPTAIRLHDIAPVVGLDFQYKPSHSHSVENLAFHETNGGGIGVLDFDLNGRPDLFFTQGDCDYPKDSHTPNGELYRNLGQAGFQAITTHAMTPDHRYGQGVTVADLNQDGFPDILVACIGINSLYINQTDGTFIRSDLGSELEMASQWTTSIACGDLNGDHRPEVVEVNYIDDPSVFTAICRGNSPVLACNPQRYQQAANRYLTLSDQGRLQLFLEMDTKQKNYGYTALIGNLFPSAGNELFIANDTEANQLWVRDPDPSKLTNQAILKGCAFGLLGNAESCMGVCAGDFDRNGLVDLHVTNFTDEPSDLFLQTPYGYFENRFSAFNLGPATMPEMGWGTVTRDLNNDGWLDLAILNGGLYYYKSGKRYQMKPQVFAGAPDQFVQTQASEIGSTYWNQTALGRTLASFDWNRDGKIDLIANHLDQPTALLENRSDEGNWVQLDLVGTQSERDAVGAVIKIQSGTDNWTAFAMGGDGYFCKSESCIHVGIGACQTIDYVEITWPSGQVSKLTNLSVNQRYLCVEGDDAFSPAASAL